MDDIFGAFFGELFKGMPLKWVLAILAIAIGASVWFMSLQTQAGLRQSFPNVRIESSTKLTKWWNPAPVLEIKGTDVNGKPITMYSGSESKTDWSTLIGKAGVCFDITAVRENTSDAIFTIDMSMETRCNANHPKLK
jgi:hypothetical protein